MFEGLPTDDLVRIAAAGGGFELNAGQRPTVDLVRIATAARSKGARLKISGLGMMSVNDLIRISAAGGGCVELSE
jgi:DNA replication protein